MTEGHGSGARHTPEQNRIGPYQAALRRARAAWIDIREKDASFFLYFGASLFGSLFGFLSIRFVLAYLSRAEYGLWGYYTALSNALVPLASLSLPAAMMRMYFDHQEREEDETATLVTTSLVISLGSAGSVLAVFLVYAATGGDPALAIYLGAVTSGTILLRFSSYLSRTRNNVALYLFNQIFEKLAIAALAGGAAVWLGRRDPAWPEEVTGRLALLAAGKGLILWISAGVNVAYYARHRVIRWSAGLLPLSRIRELLTFSTPLVGTFFLGWVLASSDIWVLRQKGSLVEIGDYVFALGIAGVVKLVTRGALIDWPRFYYAEMRDDRPDRDLRISRRVRLVTFTHAAAILGVKLVASLAYTLLGAADYRAGLGYLGFLLLGSYFTLLGNVMGAGAGFAKKTHLTLYAFLIPAIFNLAANWWLVPSYGAFGCAVTTLASYVLFTALSFGLSRPFYRFERLNGLLLPTILAALSAFIPVMD